MKVPFLSLKDVTSMHKEEIKNAINNVVDSGWYLQGAATKTFEEHYAKYIGSKHCVCVGNGLDALYLILKGYIELGRLKEGDEIIVPANTYIATIIAITDNGLKPVLVEPRFDTLEIDDELIEKNISSKTKGIMIVHLYGRCAYTDKIGEICKKHNLLLLEDNAQSHGCLFNGKKTGSLGNAAAHSFYPGKNLGAFGDAGAVTTDDDELERVVRALGNYGSSRKYVFDYIGKNSRIDEIQAAVLDVKLKYLDEDNNHRKEIAKVFWNGIKNPNITLPSNIDDDMNVYHIFPIFSKHRDYLQEKLSEKGIQTIIHYPIPPHKQKCYSKWNSFSLPITERIHQEELSIPISQYLSKEDANYIVDVLNGIDLSDLKD